MSDFDQKNQQVNNQVNADNIHININPDIHSTNLACPICMNNATTQKLSALVKEGTQASKLVEYLSLPQETTMPSNGGLGVLLLFGFYILFCGICFVPFFIATYQGGNDGTPLILIPIFLILLVSPVIVQAIIKSKIPQQKKQFEIDHQKWQHAKNKWEKSYYCRRHDIVFIPENNETVTPEKFKEFLYK